MNTRIDNQSRVQKSPETLNISDNKFVKTFIRFKLNSAIEINSNSRKPLADTLRFS